MKAKRRVYVYAIKNCVNGRINRKTIRPTQDAARASYMLELNGGNCSVCKVVKVEIFEVLNEV